MARRQPTEILDRFAAAARCAGTWCVHGQLDLPRPVDEGRLRAAAAALLAEQPILASRWVLDGRQPAWEALEGPVDPVAVVHDEAAYRALRRAPIPLEEGPLARIVLWRRPDGDRLLLTLTHAVSDGGGLLHALAALASLYRDPAARRLPAPVDGARSLGQLWRHLPLTAWPTVLGNARRRVATRRRAFPAHKLRIADDGRRTEVDFDARSLLAAPLAAFARSCDATLNDLLQAAFLRGLVRAEPWDGTTALTLNSTVDLRRHLPEGRAPAIANLSSGLLLTLGAELGADLADTVRRVAAQTREHKARRVGLSLEVLLLPLAARVPWRALERGITRALTRPPDAGPPPDGLSNVGRLDLAALAFDVEPTRALLLPQFLGPGRYQVACFGARDRVWLVSGVYPWAAREEAVGRLLDAMIAELGAAIGPLDVARCTA